MSKYIDAERLAKRLDDEFDNLFLKGFEKVPVTDIRNALMNILIEQPTVEAEEVVRCKDCKYYGEYGECEGGIMIYNNNGGCGYISPEPDDFCNHGERKEQ